MIKWKSGRGTLGPLNPLIGRWHSNGAGSGASAVACTREFTPFGKDYVQLDARWQMGPSREYREIAFFGKDGDGTLAFWSFTSDGKKSQGKLSTRPDVHKQALAFEAQMPAGLACMIYWPPDDGEGFNFAVESKTKKGWNRFFQHLYRPAS